METSVKKTGLHSWHIEQGANMADFGGYHMPLWYPTGVKTEHLSVLTSAGLFDTSHMATVLVAGANARKTLQDAFCRDLDHCVGRAKSPLHAGRCVYGVFLNEDGSVLDDAIVYQWEDDRYMVVVNAGMGADIANRIKTAGAGRDISVTDLTDNLGKLDLQGPMAARILWGLLENPGAVFDKMVYFSFKGRFEGASEVRLKDKTPILLSRTGYTGEFGFEIFIAPEKFTFLWQSIMEAGKSMGLAACGLAARDSLRSGAFLPLSHQDIGHWLFLSNPWTFVLPYNSNNTGFTKDFTGSKALLAAEAKEHTLGFAGFDLRKVTAGEARVEDKDGNDLGSVLTCTTDMGVGRQAGRLVSITDPAKPEGFAPKGLCCGFVKIRCKLPKNTPIVLKDRRRKLKAEIVDDIRPFRTARRRIADFLP